MASIYKRGNVWWIIYYPIPGAKPVQKSLKTKDKTVAKFHKNEIESRLSRGVNPLPDFNFHINKILSQYEAHCAGVNKKKTVSDDITRIRGLIEWTGCQRAIDLNENKVKEYTSHRIQNDLISHKTANRIITNTKTFLNFAVKHNYIGQNPLRFMRKYAVDRLPPKYLSKSEIKAVIEAARDNPLLPMVVTAIYSGMRLGELKRLCWKDIDLARDQITVKLAKSGKFRTIPLHPELKNILNSGKDDKTKLCFDCTNMRRLFARICAKSGNVEKIKMPGRRPRIEQTIGWHTFRHTFASHLVMSGVDMVTVSKLLGHSNIQTTMIYSHLSQEHVKDSVKKLHF